MEIILTKKHKEILASHAQNGFPNESCALLFGDDDSGTVTVRDIFLAENAQASPVNFTVSSEDLIRGYEEAEQKKMAVVGIFHSHPHSEAIPSHTDREFMVVNPVVWVIFSNKHGEFRAYILESEIVQVPVKTV